MSTPCLRAFAPTRPALRLALAALVLFLGAGFASADTVVFRNGGVETNVAVLERGLGGAITIQFGGKSLKLEANNYILCTDRDVVHLKDGRFIEGDVAEESAFAISVRAKDGSTQKFERSQVRQIYLAGQAKPLEGGAASIGLPSAVAALDKGDAVEAIKLLRDYATDGTDMSAAPALLRRAVDVALANSAAALRRDAGVKEVDDAFRETGNLLSDKRLWASGGGESAMAPFLNDYWRRQAELYLDFGDEIQGRSDVRRYPAALDAYWASERLARSFRSLVGLAEMTVAMERFRPRDLMPQGQPHPVDTLVLARDQLRRAGSTAPPEWSSRLAQAWVRLNNKERELGFPVSIDPDTLPKATPTPIGGPTPAPTPYATPAPTPEPTPVPTPATGLAGAKQQFDDFMANHVTPYWAAADRWALDALGAGVLTLALVGVVLLALNWFIPLWYMGRRIRNADFDARLWRPWVRLFGFPALAVFLAKSLAKRAKGPDGAVCEACKKSLENIELYGDLKFDKCPHCKEAIEPLFSLEDYIQHLVAQLEHMAAGEAGRAAYGAMQMGVVERDAMQKLVHALVTLGIRRRASDVHIEPEVEGAKVRMRIDGVLYDMLVAPPSITNALVSAIKVQAKLDIAERRVPQDGKISMWIDGVDVDIRVNTSPHQVAERVAMRLLDSRSIQVESTKLGMEGRNLESFEQIIRRPSGVVYLTGPTGSGKTTTLYVALNTVNDGRKNIVTIEDPIEYQLRSVNQMQVNPSQGFTFATGLRSILRGDPDVIMVGEVRDKETANIAVDAASTGHLVFTTLHTIDATSVIARLLDLGVEPRRVSSSLLAAIAQRLVRVNCPECKRPYQPTPSELKQLGMREEEIARTTFMKGAGCERCQGTSFQGRLGLFEMFVPDAAIREMIETGGSPSVVRDMARKRGMTTLREEGILRVAQGTTTVEEVIRGT